MVNFVKFQALLKEHSCIELNLVMINFMCNTNQATVLTSLWICEIKILVKFVELRFKFASVVNWLIINISFIVSRSGDCLQHLCTTQFCHRLGFITLSIYIFYIHTHQDWKQVKAVYLKSWAKWHFSISFQIQDPNPNPNPCNKKRRYFKCQLDNFFFWSAVVPAFE